MKNRTPKSMSLKSRIKNVAKEKDIAPQIVLQNFMMERFLNRVALSKYKESFIVKGGSLVSMLVGLTSRTTMDVDVTVTGFILNEKEIEAVLSTICSINLEDNVTFELKRCETIRDDDIYGGFRIFMNGYFDNKAIQVPFSLDVSTGDIITPKPQKRKWNCLLNEENSFELFAYPIETILAEKVETILSRGVLSTRPKDFYDVYVLTKTSQFDKDIFDKALEETSRHRGSFERIMKSKDNFSIIENSLDLKEFWNRYAKSNPFSKGLDYEKVIATIKELLFK